MNKRSLSKWPLRVLLFAGLAFCAGCGASDNMGEVFGTIQFDGKPIEAGAITFYPADGKSPTAGGAIKDGRYSARVPLGKSKVVFHGTKIVGRKKLYDTPNSPIMDIHEELLPVKYTQQSQVEFEVQPGKNEKNWELAK